jgi:hypothetical protein
LVESSVGFMDFGIDSALGFCVGVLMCANAVLNLLVLMYHPDFCNGTLAGSMDPTASYNSGLDVRLSLSLSLC